MNLTPSQMLDVLLGRLTEVLRERDLLDGLCSTAVYPGEQVPADYGLENCGGMAWVHLASSVPSVQFPSAATSLDNCTHSLAHTVQMGIWRPVVGMTTTRSGVSLPSDEQHQQMTYRQMDDMQAMHDAVAKARKDIDLVILGQYSPQGPEGGIVGGSWNINVGNSDPD